MKKLAVSHHFQKQLDKLPAHEQTKITESLKSFLTALQKGPIPMGFGFKKINGDKYELRVNLRLRIAMKADSGVLVCHLIGNHEEIRKYLRNFRNK